MKKNIIVGQSGGPTAVINGSLYGVVSEGLRHPDEIAHVYGMVNGIEGFLADRFMDMEALAEKRRAGVCPHHPGGLPWLLPLQAAGRPEGSGLSPALPEA